MIYAVACVTPLEQRPFALGSKGVASWRGCGMTGL